MRRAKKANKLLENAGATDKCTYTVCQRFEGMAHKSLHDLNMPKWQLDFFRETEVKSEQKAAEETVILFRLTDD